MSLPVLALTTFGTSSGCAHEEDDERATVKPAPSRPGESMAESLHRHGVRCMDDLERHDCAEKYLTELVELDPGERELVGDAIFRLVRIKRARGEDDEIKKLLRHYWELGMSRPAAGNMPWGAKYLPADVTIATLVDVKRLRSSFFFRQLTVDARDTMFTCDETRRKELETQRDARKAQRKADAEAQAEVSGEADKGKKGKGNDERKSRRPERKDRPSPIGEKGLCELGNVLGRADLVQWNRFFMAQSHSDPAVSAVIGQLDDLDALVQDAVGRGTLTQVGERQFRLTSFKFNDREVDLLVLDRNEATLVPATMSAAILAARDKVAPSLNAELERQIAQVPGDSVFYTTVTRSGMETFVGELGTIGKFLPSPDGLLISSACYADAGVFFRMPTKDRLKMQILVAIARKILANQATEAAETGSERASIYEQMDISESPDKAALIFSLILTRGQVESMFLSG